MPHNTRKGPEQPFAVMLEAERDELDVHSEENDDRSDSDIRRHPAECIHGPCKKRVPAAVNPLRDIRDCSDVGSERAGTDGGHQPEKKAATIGTGLLPIVPRICIRSISGEIPVQAFTDCTCKICLVFFFIAGQVPDVHVLQTVNPAGIIRRNPQG